MQVKTPKDSEGLKRIGGVSRPVSGNGNAGVIIGVMTQLQSHPGRLWLEAFDLYLYTGKHPRYPGYHLFDGRVMVEAMSSSPCWKCSSGTR